MSAIALDLGELYGRYKRLTLAAAAGLLAGEGSPELEDEVRALRADATHAVRDADSATLVQLRACANAAAELEQLVVGGQLSLEGVERVRQTHSELRREVWKVIPCEYVPCNAGASMHREEQR
jgi:hypothetical protein